MKLIPICMPAYNRPHYLREVLTALGKCECLDQFVVVASVEPGQPETVQVFKEAFERFPNKGLHTVSVNDTQLGCNGNVLHAMEHGFALTEAPWAMCLEDDVVLARDALRWMIWANRVFGNQPDCFSVCAYQVQRFGQPVNYDDTGKSIFRGTILPWGWAITQEKFQDARYWWDRQPEGRPGLWDDNLCYYMAQKMWYEVCPVVSRAQNIGAVGFNANANPFGYGSQQHWKEFQNVYGFIGDVQQTTRPRRPTKPLTRHTWGHSSAPTCAGAASSRRTWVERWCR
jgi:GT2 family glycosyltransferase